jgi:hypothetical protein
LQRYSFKEKIKIFFAISGISPKAGLSVKPDRKVSCAPNIKFLKKLQLLCATAKATAARGPTLLTFPTFGLCLFYTPQTKTSLWHFIYEFEALIFIINI